MDFSMIKLVPTTPCIFGPIGRGDRMEKFYKAFKVKRVPGCDNTWVVGRKSDIGVDQGCGNFSIKTSCNGWDIAFYDQYKAKEVFDNLKTGEPMDALYVDNDPLNKYLAMDLIKILIDTGFVI
jgi:hypothetical protein